MAQQTIVQYVDDIDGTPSDSVETVHFSVDGVSYEIDLNDTNRARLRDALTDYLAKARRIGGRRRSAASATPASGGRAKTETEAIRQWARANGHQISDRGRIPSRVVQAYEAAK